MRLYLCDQLALAVDGRWGSSLQHVFISYRRQDGDFAENLIAKVEKEGFATWSDAMIGAGEEWRTAIDLAIRNSFVLVVIMTPEAKSSEYVTYEWAFAWGVGIRVIPVMLQPTNLHPRLGALQYLDFTSLRSRPWARLFDEIRSAAQAPLSCSVTVPLNSQPFIRQAAAALDSANPSERQAAVETLVAAGIPAAFSVLAEALQHPLPDVRLKSAEALGKAGDSSVSEALVELLSDSVNDVCEAAANALGDLDDAFANEALCNMLRDQDWRKRLMGARALGRVGESSCLTALGSLLEDSSAEVRAGAAEALGRIGASSMVDSLIRLSDDPDWRVRRASARSLGQTGQSRPVEVLNSLKDLLSDYDGLVREAAIMGIGEFEDCSVLATNLVGSLEDPDDLVRLRAVELLGDIGESSAIAPLTLLLRDPDNLVRRAAAEALDSIRSPKEVINLPPQEAARETAERIRARYSSMLGRDS